MPTSAERGEQQNKTLSDPTDATLALQGVGWMLRKTIGMAAVTLHVKQYTGPPRAPSTSAEDATHIDVEQTLTGGVQGNAERRCLDWEAREHSDWLFGTVRGQSRFVSLSDLNSWVPETYGAYLRGSGGGGKDGGADEDDDDGGEDTTAAGQERREKLGEDTDSILDEIDDVLEENAEDFVRAYVQKGGE